MSNFFKIKNIQIYNSKVINEIKISEIADIHISHLIIKRKLDKITSYINEFNPDYVCIPGDLLDYLNILEEKEYFEMLTKWLTSLASFRPVLISLGSHDMGIQVSKIINERGWIESNYYEFFKELEMKVPNLYVLDNKNYQDDKIFVSGYTQTFEYCYSSEDVAPTLMDEDLKKQDFILKAPINKPACMLVHDPMHLTSPKVKKYFENYDILFSGHMHNAMVPPIIDELWKSNKGFIKPNKSLIAPNARGIVPIDIEGKIVYLIVTGGIVKIQETAPKILWPCNNFYPSSIDNIVLTPNCEYIKPKVKSYYKF